VPEGPEVETERLHEAIEEELKHEGGRFLKMVALTTSLFAAVAAVGALRAGATVNEALVLKTEAARLQAEASDQWAYYQAKGIKAAVQEASAASWLAVGKEPPAEAREKERKYVAEQADIEKEARRLEALRDAKSAEAEALLHKHHGFANAVAILQVSIALGAVSALVRNRVVWLASVLAGLVALAILLVTWSS
jgi:uncharacterized protein DUF4337